MEFNVKFKDYSPATWQKINSTLENVLTEQKTPIAAFDADGTLWDIDLGETFFHYLIDHKKVRLPADPWTHYEELKKQSPTAAYLWLAQICEGQTLKNIHEWAKEALQGAHPVPVFGPQKQLVDLFISRGVQVYIITASVKWSVEPGAALFNLPPESVIGVETEIQNETVTNQQKGTITYRNGKVEALLSQTSGQKPFFACGNSEGDQELLGCATHMSLAVSASHRDDRLFRSEEKLMKLAESRGWLTHRFV